jgi:hypothetical protein
MGRLVRKPTLPDAEPQASSDFGGMFQSRGRQAATGTPGDDYLTRIVKYVPAEIIGCSMLVNSILAQAMTASSDATMAGIAVTTIAAGALLVGLILTPLFCWYVREDGDAWLTNAVVSTIAFPFWAYLMGAVAFAKFHDGNLAAILILTFTAVSGLVAPVVERPRLAEQKANPKDGPRLVESLKA